MIWNCLHNTNKNHGKQENIFLFSNFVDLHKNLVLKQLTFLLPYFQFLNEGKKTDVTQNTVLAHFMSKEELICYSQSL